MSLERYRMIETWTEADLLLLTEGENDEYEYKSSKIHASDLMKEIQVAASAFWNSGGGMLIVGMDDTGCIDGGISDLMGRQRLKDWVDRVLSHVEPPGPYLVRLVYGNGNGTRIEHGCCVLIIAYGESNNAPHMAPDKRYYVRAGAHSDPAGHFLVEAIRARRRLQKPVLRGLLRANPDNARIIELLVLALNDTPALDVRMDFDIARLPSDAREQLAERLPLYIPVIDQEHPFTMDASWFGVYDTKLTQHTIHLNLQYQDLAGREYDSYQPLNPSRSIAPLGPSDENALSGWRNLEEISKQIRRLRKTLEQGDKFPPNNTR